MSLVLSLASLHNKITPNQTSTEYLLAKISASSGVSKSQTKLSAVLILDVSGSMKGEPIQQVIQSAQRLSELLGDEDSLGIVTFSNEAQIIAPLAPLSSMHRKSIQKSLSTLAASGGTNISAGLAQASKMFGERAREQRFVALLLTDGHPTHGATTAPMMANEVTALRQRDISVSSLGFGANHKEELLIEAAEAGGGRYFYISDAKLSEGNFIKALGSQRDVIAEQVKLSIQPSTGVEISHVYGSPKLSFGSDGLQLSLPDLVDGNTINLIVKLSTSLGAGFGERALLSATLRAVSTSSHEPLIQRETASVALSLEGAGVALEVAAHVALAQAAELRDQARAKADVRDFSGAKQLLTQAKSILEATPGFVFGEQSVLTDGWETIVDDISAMEREPDAHEYQEYRKSQRDYLDFAAQGPSACGGALIDSPSARAMSARSQSAPLPEAYLIITERGGTPKRLQITNHEMTIGRVQGNSIVLPKGNVSKQNARICFMNGAFYVFDMKSTNGTYINSRKVNQTQALQNGDKIYIGDFEIQFEGPSAQKLPPPPPPIRGR